MKRKQSPKRLRKQPPARRMQVATPVYGGDLDVPGTARRRRRRNRPAVRSGIAAAKWVLFSARWISLAVFVLCAYGLYLIGQEPGFYLNEIPVDGANYLAPAEVIDASQLAGIHVFAADPEEAARQIDALPGVLSASVVLQWPNQVSIQIHEETPIVIWEQEGRDYWVNDRGELIPARTAVPGLLRIRAEKGAFTLTEAEQDSAEADMADAVDEAAAVTPIPFVPAEVLAGALRLRALRPNIDALYYRPGGGLSYQDGRGWRAYFGVGSDMEQKLVVYELLVENLLERQLTPEYISVSNQEKPYYRARGSG